MFSLYADRVEAFIRSELSLHALAQERAAVRLAGLTLPLLLFADDIVLLGTGRAVVQR